jgi:hypothetical protein
MITKLLKRFRVALNREWHERSRGWRKVEDKADGFAIWQRTRTDVDLNTGDTREVGLFYTVGYVTSPPLPTYRGYQRVDGSYVSDANT